MIATIILIAIGNREWVRYAFTFLLCAGVFGIYSTTYTWLSSTIVRPPVKRAAAIGIANTCANIASLFANYFWLDEYGPLFTQSWGCLLAFQVLGLACILTLRYSLKRSNRKFERLASDEAGVADYNDDEQRAVQNGFRFVT